MPARKPIGAETSAETRTSGCGSMIGCQSAAQRTRTTSPKPKPANRRVIQNARIHPAPRRCRRHLPWVGLGAWWTSWPVTVVVTLGSSLLLLGGLDEELPEGVELRLRARLPERLRHHALRVAGLHVGVRVDDRLVDESGERLLRLLRVRDEVVEVRPDLARRAGGAQRVAARAAVRIEDREAGRRGRRGGRRGRGRGRGRR